MNKEKVILVTKGGEYILWKADGEMLFITYECVKELMAEKEVDLFDADAAFAALMKDDLT